MTPEIGSFTTNSTTGTRNITLASVTNPTSLDFWVGKKSGVDNVMDCDGEWNSTVQFCTGSFMGMNGTTPVLKKIESTSRVAQVYEVVSGAASLVVDIAVISAASGTLSLSIPTTVTGYRIFYKANP